MSGVQPRQIKVLENWHEFHAHEMPLETSEQQNALIYEGIRSTEHSTYGNWEFQEGLK